ncbi:MAG TPA: ATP-binding protein, partial [Chitinophagales bacterium]|nr:ATP-binding protein [Chitinophagales bacterium]
YAKPDVPPCINITTTIINGTDIALEGADPNGQYHKIDIVDNGIGFEQEYAAKIFEIFQRLHKKNEYTGTGIGLAICKRIVQNHKGFIEASSSPGQGADFTIYLPV